MLARLARLAADVVAAPARVRALEARIAALELERPARRPGGRRPARTGLELLDVFARTR